MTKPEKIVHLKGISTKAEEMRLQYLLRERKYKVVMEEKPKEPGKWASPKREGAAEAPGISMLDTYYKPDKQAPMRQGSEDHKRYSSLDDKGSAIYHRGHV